MKPAAQRQRFVALPEVSWRRKFLRRHREINCLPAAVTAARPGGIRHGPERMGLPDNWANLPADIIQPNATEFQYFPFPPMTYVWPINRCRGDGSAK